MKNLILICLISLSILELVSPRPRQKRHLLALLSAILALRKNQNQTVNEHRVIEHKYTINAQVPPDEHHSPFKHHIMLVKDGSFVKGFLYMKPKPWGFLDWGHHNHGIWNDGWDPWGHANSWNHNPWNYPNPWNYAPWNHAYKSPYLHDHPKYITPDHWTPLHDYSKYNKFDWTSLPSHSKYNSHWEPKHQSAPSERNWTMNFSKTEASNDTSLPQNKTKANLNNSAHLQEDQIWVANKNNLSTYNQNSKGEISHLIDLYNYGYNNSLHHHSSNQFTDLSGKNHYFTSNQETRPINDYRFDHHTNAIPELLNGDTANPQRMNIYGNDIINQGISYNQETTTAPTDQYSNGYNHKPYDLFVDYNVTTPYPYHYTNHMDYQTL